MPTRTRQAFQPTRPTPRNSPYLPWEGQNLNGQRLATRNEVDWPVQMGPVKVVPYALGELANWGDDLQHDDFSRAYGILGLRASLPFWAVDPTIQSDLFNVHGVAHKIDLTADISLQQATGNLSSLPLYDPIDDESIQHFERRFAFNTYGTIPGTGLPTGMPGFPDDLRSRAITCSAAARANGSPARRKLPAISSVIRLDVDQRLADEARAARRSAHHRLDHARHRDGSLSRHETELRHGGRAVRLRLPLVRRRSGDACVERSDRFLQRRAAGDLVRRVSQSPLARQYLSRLLCAQRSHSLEHDRHRVHLSDVGKWATTFGTTFDVSPNVNIGQSFTVTRIGESFLTTVGVTVDASRGTVGANLMIEPRALGRERLVKPRGLEIPAAGVNGLE